MINKRIFIILAVILIASSSCAYRRDIPPDEQPRQGVEDREDRLSKSDQEAVEENINGFGIEDDVKITREETNRVSYLSQNQKKELLINMEDKETNTTVEVFDSRLPEGVNETIEYHEYNISYDYFLVTSEEGVNIRENPENDSTEIVYVDYLDKVSLIYRVEGELVNDSNIWYRVGFQNEEVTNEGYIHSSLGMPRNYRFESMYSAVYELIEELEEGELHFVSNYKNVNGTPPQEGDIAVDEYGYRVYHSAAAYEHPNIESNYRYIPDGILVRVLDEVDDFYHVNVPTFGGDYYVEKQFIDLEVTLRNLEQVIVIDRTQQNQGAFEVDENGLNLVSYTFATTGIPGEFSFETTLGSYKAIQVRDRFQYLESGTQDIAGYAPYAIRFTGGAYIHGVPVAYEEIDGEKVDPGVIEYLHTIGTFPRSNMCVRNFTSHAEFLYNWISIENAAIIVIE